MTQENIRELAKQGNPKALATMLNRSLKPKDITAKVGMKNDCLQILLESAQIPDQEAMVSFIRNGLIKLEVESINTVKVYGRQLGEESPAWNQTFELMTVQDTPIIDELIDDPILPPIPPLDETQNYIFSTSNIRQAKRQNLPESPAISPNPSSRQSSESLSVGDVVSAALRIYRDHFKLYLGLAFTSFLWAFIPIYGWAKSYQIQAIIANQVFSELVNKPESVSTIRARLKPRIWDFWVAQILIGLICFGVSLGLSLISLVIVFVLNVLLAAIAQGNSVVTIFIILLQIAVRLTEFFVYLWFYSRFFIAELPLAIETNMTSVSCISRSWELTKRLVFRIQMIIFIAILITIPIISLSLTPLWLMITSFTGLASPESLGFAILSLVFWGLILLAIGNTFIMPFWQAIKAVIYYDLRSRREGLGLQLRDSR